MLAFVGLFGGLGGFLYGIYRAIRRKSWRPLAWSLVSIGLGIWLILLEVERSAKLEGWQSAADKTQAGAVGITDPAAWAAHQQAEASRLSAERAAEQAKLQAERDAEAARVAAAEAAAKAEEEAAQARIRLYGHHCLSAWDGAHSDFEAQVTRLMRDPDSFEHIQTRTGPVNEQGNNPIWMDYRARNGFGGMNVGTAIGWIDNRTCAASVVSVE